MNSVDYCDQKPKERNRRAHTGGPTEKIDFVGFLMHQDYTLLLFENLLHCHAGKGCAPDHYSVFFGFQVLWRFSATLQSECSVHFVRTEDRRESSL